METIQKTLLVITIIGALNWGFIGLFEMDLVSSLFGDQTFMTKLVYTLVGISGLVNIGILFNHIETN